MNQPITGKDHYQINRGKEVEFCKSIGRIVGYRPNGLLIAEIVEVGDFEGWHYKRLTDGDWVEIGVSNTSMLMYVKIDRLDDESDTTRK
jgi:hypothetical protein